MKKINKKDEKIEEMTEISQWFLSTLVFYIDEIRRKCICAWDPQSCNIEYKKKNDEKIGVVKKLNLFQLLLKLWCVLNSYNIVI